MTDEEKPKRKAGRPPHPEPHVRRHFYIREEDADTLDHYARTRGLSMSEVIRRLVYAAH
jgi:hypothetical protein